METIMTQNIQDLINKIKTEGVEASSKKAQEIEQAAQRKAEEIVAKARAQAEQIVSQAKDQAKKQETATNATLKQAARDTLLSLRSEILRRLKAIVSAQVKEGLKPEQVASLLTEVVKAYVAKHPGVSDIRVALPEQQLKAFSDGSLKALQGQLKASITLERADQLSSGFLISFDGGKSSFDFSNESLTSYMSAFVNAEVAKLLKEAGMS